MNSTFYHIQFNVDLTKNREFYRSMMTTLGWKLKYEADDMFGFSDKNGVDLWFIGSESNDVNNYDNLGVNHLSIKVEAKEDIDKFVEDMRSQNLEPLFETPRHRPEFAESEDHTYYQVMFKTSDNILFEVVYTGKNN